MLVNVSQWACFPVGLGFEFELKLSVLRKTLTAQATQVGDIVPSLGFTQWPWVPAFPSQLTLNWLQALAWYFVTLYTFVQIQDQT